MFQHCLSIRLRTVKSLAFTVCVLFAASCSKERTISIPKRLAGREWTMNGEEGIKVLRFLSDTECTLTQEPPRGKPQTFHYDYSCRKPDLTLTPQLPAGGYAPDPALSFIYPHMPLIHLLIVCCRGDHVENQGL